MGLDMHLYGKKDIWSAGDEPPPMEDGYRLRQRVLELGYWRKHWPLHTWIVNQFSRGEDDCRPIELDSDQLRRIRQAVADNEILGEDQDACETCNYYRDETLLILDQAIAWVAKRSDSEWRSVAYRASW